MSASPNVITIRTAYYECKFSSAGYLQWRLFPSFLYIRGGPLGERRYLFTWNNLAVYTHSLPAYVPNVEALYVPGIYESQNLIIVKFSEEVILNRKTLLEFKTGLDSVISKHLNKHV